MYSRALRAKSKGALLYFAKLWECARVPASLFCVAISYRAQIKAIQFARFEIEAVFNTIAQAWSSQ
jgi:hypothetical protein